jgi:hypothetical protein
MNPSTRPAGSQMDFTHCFQVVEHPPANARARMKGEKMCPGVRRSMGYINAAVRQGLRLSDGAALLRGKCSKSYPWQLIPNRRHSIFDWSFANKYEFTFFHHTNRGRQSR